MSGGLRTGSSLSHVYEIAMLKISILRVKQYLALDADNHYVPAKEVQPGKR
ncbi:hypothetical protein [Yersinia enterocolitica]|uniref:hypothetical protein n=1 Tax=Yersinia enterocolitica TaxID=630 RepID=UPI003D01802A